MGKHKWKLFSVIVLSMMATTSIVVNAEKDDEVISAETTGKVNFKVDETGGPVVVDPTDPDNPNVIDPGDEGSSGNGKRSFNINWVSNFKFDDMTITGREITQYASSTTLNFKQPEGEGSESIESKENLPNFIQVTDNRGTNTGWKVIASASEFKQAGAGNNVLTGAQLLLTNPQIFNHGSSPELSPTAHTSGIDLLDNDDQGVEIIKAKGQNGQGTWSMAWSPKAAGENYDFSYNDEEDKGVQLIVPMSAKPKIGEAYISTITWVLSDTPDK